MICRVGRNVIVVHPPEEGAFAYMDQFFWFVKWEPIEVTVCPYGMNVRENGVLVEVHAHET